MLKGGWGGRLPPSGLALLACLLAAAPFVFEWLSYAYVFRDMQRAAERQAYFEFAQQVVPEAPYPRRYRPPPYARISEFPPRAGAYAGRQSAYRVTLLKDWRSPLFGLRRRIAASATVALLPTERSDEARIAAVE